MGFLCKQFRMENNVYSSHNKSATKLQVKIKEAMYINFKSSIHQANFSLLSQIFLHVFFLHFPFALLFPIYVFYSCCVSYSRQERLNKTGILTCIFNFTPAVTDNDRRYCRNMYLRMKSVVHFLKYIMILIG